MRKTLFVFLLAMSLFFSSHISLLAGQLVNVNNATLEQLTVLPGIGEKTAQKIIEYRKVHKFKDKEEIMQVKGIGKSKFEKIKDRITAE